MKKSFALILAVAMLMMACVACGGTADKNLPEGTTRIQDGSLFVIEGGAIAKMVAQGKNADGSYYVYTNEGGKSSNVAGESRPLSSVVFSQFDAAAKAVAAAVKAGTIKVADSCEVRFSADVKAGYGKITKDGHSQAYYVYAIEKNTLTLGEGAYTGATTLGVLEFKLADGSSCLVAFDR